VGKQLGRDLNVDQHVEKEKEEKQKQKKKSKRKKKNHMVAMVPPSTLNKDEERLNFVSYYDFLHLFIGTMVSN
jgi:hypothetical protein